MDIHRIYMEIRKQMAYAEDITGCNPERIILGSNIFNELITTNEFINCLGDSKSDVILYGMYVTIDYRNKNIIKVVPEIKI